MVETNSKHIPLIIILYLTYFYSGVVENLKGVVFPLIKDYFNATYDQQGLLVSISWFGYVISCIVATFSVEHFSNKCAFMSGYILIIVGSLLVQIIPNFPLSILIMTIIWMGFGFYELSGNTLATTLFTSSSAIWMNLLHFFYGVGAIVGPYFASWMISLIQQSFKSPYIPVAVVLFITLIVMIFVKFDVKSISENEEATMTVCDALKDWLVWYSAISLGFMEVIEFGASNWGALYYRDVYGLDITTDGATFVSMFYIFFTVTRLVSGFWIEKIGYLNSIIVSLVATIAIYLIGFFMGVNGRWVIPLTGFFIGLLFPTYMCVGMEMYGQDGSVATNVMIVISGATNGLVQYIVGIINEYIGNEWGFRCNIIYTAIPLILMIILKCVLYHYKKIGKPIHTKKEKTEIQKTKEIELGNVDTKQEDKLEPETIIVHEQRTIVNENVVVDENNKQSEIVDENNKQSEIVDENNKQSEIVIENKFN